MLKVVAIIEKTHWYFQYLSPVKEKEIEYQRYTKICIHTYAVHAFIQFKYMCIADLQKGHGLKESYFGINIKSIDMRGAPMFIQIHIMNNHKLQNFALLFHINLLK